MSRSFSNDPFIYALDAPGVGLPVDACLDLLRNHGGRGHLPQRTSTALLDSLANGVTQYINRLTTSGLGDAWTFQSSLVPLETSARRIRKITGGASSSSVSRREGRSHSMHDLSQVLHCIWFVSKPPPRENCGIVVFDNRREEAHLVSTATSGSLVMFPATWTYTYDYRNDTEKKSFVVYEGGLRIRETQRFV